MEEAVMYGVAVALLMLGVPLWHSMGECRKGRLVRLHLCRWWLICGFMVMMSLMIAVLFGLAGFVLQNSPPPRAARLPADCKILSKDVDIRSTKVCEVGQMVHLPKGGKNPNVPPKFRCSLDYYWTSVFKVKVCMEDSCIAQDSGIDNNDIKHTSRTFLKWAVPTQSDSQNQVEYMPHASNSVIKADAELPSEALPTNCRPGFGAAWRTKEIFKVNGTYPCKYSPKNRKMVDIIADIAGNCNTGEPSSSDLIRQFWYLLIHSENSIFSPSGKTGELFSRAAAAVGLGICYSMIVTGFTRTVCQVHFHFEHGEYSDLDVVYFEARIQLAILFTASLFGLIYLSNHYVRDDVDVELFINALYKRAGFAELGQHDGA